MSEAMNEAMLEPDRSLDLEDDPVYTQQGMDNEDLIVIWGSVVGSVALMGLLMGAWWWLGG